MQGVQTTAQKAAANINELDAKIDAKLTNPTDIPVDILKTALAANDAAILQIGIKLAAERFKAKTIGWGILQEKLTATQQNVYQALINLSKKQGETSANIIASLKAIIDIFNTSHIKDVLKAAGLQLVLKAVPSGAGPAEKISAAALAAAPAPIFAAPQKLELTKTQQQTYNAIKMERFIWNTMIKNYYDVCLNFTQDIKQNAEELREAIIFVERHLQSYEYLLPHLKDPMLLTALQQKNSAQVNGFMIDYDLNNPNEIRSNFEKIKTTLYNHQGQQTTILQFLGITSAQLRDELPMPHLETAAAAPTLRL